MQIVINPKDFTHSLQLSQEHLLNGIAIWLSQGSGWTIVRIDEHYINTAVFDVLRGSSYIPLPKEFQNPQKGLINIKNDDNECFRWCHLRYLNPQEKNSRGLQNRTRKCYLI